MTRRRRPGGHRRTVQGLRGDIRKVRDLKARMSDERADRACGMCPECGGEGGTGTDDPEDWVECLPCEGTGHR